MMTEGKAGLLPQAPDAMRSLGSALQLLTTALGSYVATAVTSIVASVTTR